MTHAAFEAKSIASGVNEPRFLEHLRTLFSTSTTVLAECLQNGRRAGASAVVFEYDVGGSTLTITDNGCGIADFRALITVAESSWSPETMQNERPFGIGFFSVSVAADQVRVESKGRQIEFSSDDLIAKRQIQVEPSSFIGGTRITLVGCKLNAATVGKALAAYASGFAVPVMWRGQELPRPHARAHLAGVETDVGFVHVPGIHGGRTADFGTRAWVYCQGLPVRVNDVTPRYGRGDEPIIHVDHLRYLPRMPDRDTLIDSEAAAQDFSMAIRTIWRTHLLEQKGRLPAAAFAETYWDTARRLDCLDVMCDVPVLPKDTLVYVSETPRAPREHEDFWDVRDVCATREEVESGAVELYEGFPLADTGDDFARLMWAQQAKVVFVVGPLPEGHWVEPHLRDLSDGTARISGRVVAQGEYAGIWTGGMVRIVDGLAVTLAGRTYALTEPVALGHGDGGATRTFLVPKGTLGGSDVLRQASTYTDDDRPCDTDHELDCARFDDLVAILSGESAVATLTKCLAAGNAACKSNLRNSAFRVQIDADGGVTVTAE